MSAMVESSVSPERWLITAVEPARFGDFNGGEGSVNVPIWLILIRMELDFFVNAFFENFGVGHEQIVADESHF